MTQAAEKSVLDLELEDLEGVGPAKARKMREAGISSVIQLATASAEELALDTGWDKDAAASVIMSAQKLLRESNFLDKEFMTGDQVLEKRKAIRRCSTGSSKLDELLLGGIETHAITEFFGEFGSGKSQLCHTLCVIARQPAPAGLDGDSIWIDTEGTFRPERVDQIARARGLDSDAVLRSIHVAKVHNSSHLELIVKELGKYIEQFNARLVVVDSVISLHRAEFSGRGTLAERQQKLNQLMHKLARISEVYGVATVITNQVQSTPDTFFGDPTRPAGGNVIGHSSTYRIYLRKAGSDRVARIIDSPYHAYGDVRFTVNEKGVDDIDDGGGESAAGKATTRAKKKASAKDDEGESVAEDADA
ncbi:MAG: DNA repair and recombination protein RadA [Nitrososphaera sp.]|jgi:DNA repair protein RadA